MLSKALMGVVALFFLYILIMYASLDPTAIIISIGWIAVLSLWARLAQASEHRGQRKREHAQLLQALGWEPLEEEPKERPWSPNIPTLTE